MKEENGMFEYTLEFSKQMLVKTVENINLQYDAIYCIRYSIL